LPDKKELPLLAESHELDPKISKMGNICLIISKVEELF
jgi:hypothetical protein